MNSLSHRFLLLTAALLLFAASDTPAGPDTWTSLDGPLGGSIRCFAVSPAAPDTIYAGTPFGVYRSLTGGGNWAPVNRGLASRNIYSLSVHPSNAGIVFAAAYYGGIFRSLDGGATWARCTEGLTGTWASLVCTHPRSPGIVFAGIDGSGFFRSADNGATWAPVGAGQVANARSMAFHPTNPSRVYVGTSSAGTFRSDDGGVTFTPLGALPSGSVRALVQDPNDAARLWAGIYGQGVYRSVNAGDTWEIASTGLDGSTLWSVDADRSQSGVLVAAGGGKGAYRTTNGGDTWTPLGGSLAGGTFFSVLGHPTVASRFYLGGLSGEGAFLSTNQGESWTPVNSGLTALDLWALAVAPTPSPTVYTSGSHRLYRKEESGLSWTELPQPGTGPWVSEILVDPSSPSTLLAGTAGEGVFRSINGGNTWSASNTGLTVLDVAGLARAPSDPQVIYAPAGIGRVFRSTDGGATWTDASAGLTDQAPSRQVVVDPANPAIAYLAQDSYGVFRTADGGTTWTSVSTGIDWLFVSTLAHHPTQSGTVLIGTRGSGIFRTTNSGASWTGCYQGLPESVIVNHILYDPDYPNLVYAATNFGVYRSLDSGTRWAPCNEGFPADSVPVVNRLAFHPTDPARVYAATDSLGVLTFTRLNHLVAAHVVGSTLWSTRLSLVNPGTTAASAQLRAYSAAGQLLETVSLPALEAKGHLDATAEDLFTPATLAQDLWVEVGSDGFLQGTLDFGTTDGLALTAMPMNASAGVELVFPYVYISAAAGGSFYTGLTVVNLEAAEAALHLEAYDENGVKLSERDETLAGYGKYVRLVDQAFPGVADPNTIRLVRVTSDRRLAGFELFGKWGEMGVAGLPAVSLALAAAKGDGTAPEPMAAAASETIYYPEILGNFDYYTGVTFSNLGTAPMTATTDLYDVSGNRIGGADWAVAPFQQVTREVWAAAGMPPNAFASWMRVTADGRLSGFELVLSRSGNFRFDGLNAPRFPSRKACFPALFAGAGWNTVLKSYNLGTATVTVTVTGYRPNGTVVGVYSQPVAARMRLFMTLNDLFPGSVADVAWLTVEIPSGIMIADLLAMSQDNNRLVFFPGQSIP
ncbi:MAG: hypothetical protein KA419_17260 [Acidobacteria bacterium]|nr:hypothetical protein [Acidobacteriota bacterium]